MKYSKDVKELITERISVMPSNFKLSIGNYGTFSKEQLLQSIQDEDKVGLEVIRMQLNFINALTSGRFTDALNNE
ncbi:MAG: hypothetical protein WC916_06265 [Candidatus Woesearchaeota archaeon]